MDRLENMSDTECSESSESNGNTSSSDSSDSHHSGLLDVATEPARILKQTLELPKGLCEDASIFNEFFSLNTLHQLGPQMQSHLQQFLPKFSNDAREDALEKQRTLFGLFGDELERFGSTPLSDLQRNLEDGNYRPEIARFRSNIQKSQRREHRFQECERVSRVAKTMMISREKLLKFAHDSPAGTSFKVNHHRSVNGNVAGPASSLPSSVATQRSKKRYFNDIANISIEAGLRDESLTDDESYPGEPSSHMTRKQRRQLNGMQGGAMSPGSESRVQSTTAPRGGCLDHLVDAGGSFTLSDDFYRQSIYQHKKRKMGEPDHPELMTKDVELIDILGRTHLSASVRRALLQAKPVLKKSKIKVETTSSPVFVHPPEPILHQPPQIFGHPDSIQTIPPSVIQVPTASPPTVVTQPEFSSPLSLPPPSTSPTISLTHTTLPSTVFQHTSPSPTSFHQKLPPPTSSIQQELFAHQSNDFQSESESEDEQPIKAEPISPPPTPVRAVPISPEPQKLLSTLRSQLNSTPSSSKLIISVTENGKLPEIKPPTPTPKPHPQIQTIVPIASPICVQEEVIAIMNEPQPQTTVFQIKPEAPTVSVHLAPIPVAVHQQSPAPPSIHLPQYGGRVKAATMSDLEGIDMMHLPVDLDDSGDIGILNEMEDVEIEIENKPPELDFLQDTHSSFFALIRDIFCSTPNHRTTMDHLHEHISGWLANPVTALNDWYIEAEDWLTQIHSAIQFLVGEFHDQPDEFVPYVEYKPQLSIYQWIGAGRDSDQHLNPLCDFWLHRRYETANTSTNNHNAAAANQPDLSQPRSAKVSVTEGEDSESGSNLERPCSPLPPRCPTAWTVAKANDLEVELFRDQERQRFEYPHLSFTYRLHGFESVVGPVKGIYTQIPVLTKARGHTMLTVDRPSFVTILTLVRDATARLPNGEGTRADICQLLRSSQYINPDAADNVLQTIVSGALDRMHTEHDPCVRFDPKRKIWIYLHRNRSEEEFERMHQQFQGVSKHKKQSNRKIKGKSLIRSPLIPTEVRPPSCISPITPKRTTVSVHSPAKGTATSPLTLSSAKLLPSSPMTVSTPKMVATPLPPIVLVSAAPVSLVDTQTIASSTPAESLTTLTVEPSTPIQSLATPLPPPQPLVIKPKPPQPQEPVNQTIFVSSAQPTTMPMTPIPALTSIQAIVQPAPVVISSTIPSPPVLHPIVQTPTVFSKLAASKKSLVKADLIPIKPTNTVHKFEKIEPSDIEATLDAHNPPILVNKPKITLVQNSGQVPSYQTQKLIHFNVETKNIPTKKTTKLIMSSPSVLTTSSAQTSIAHSTSVNSPSMNQMQFVHNNSTTPTSTIKVIQSNETTSMKPMLNVTIAKQSDTGATQSIVLSSITPKTSLIKATATQPPTTSMSMPSQNPQPAGQQSILIQNQNNRSQSPMFVPSNVMTTTTKKIIKPPPLVAQQQQVQTNNISGTNFMIPMNISTQSTLQSNKGVTTSSQLNHVTTISTQAPKTFQRSTSAISSSLTKGVSLLQQLNQKPIVRTTSIPPGKSLINPSVVAANISIQQQQKNQNIIPANVVSIQGRTAQSSPIVTQKIVSTSTTRTQPNTLTTAQQRQILQNIIAQQKQQRLNNPNNTINLVPNSVLVSTAQSQSQSKPITVSQTNAGGFVQRIVVSSAAPATSIIFTTSNAAQSTTMTVAASGHATKTTSATTTSGTSLVNRQVIQIQQNNQQQSATGGQPNKVKTVSTSNMTPQQQQNLLQSIKQQQIRVLNQQATATPQQQTLIVKQQQVLQQIQKQLQHQQLNNQTIKPGTSLLNHSTGTVISTMSTANTTPTTTSGTMTRIIRPGIIRQAQTVQTVSSNQTTTAASSPVMAKMQNTTGQIISLESLLQKQGHNIGSGTTLRVAGSKSGQASIIQISGASGTAATQYAVVSQGLHGRSMISLTSAPQRLTTNATTTSSSASSTSFGTTLLKPITDTTNMRLANAADTTKPQQPPQTQQPKLVQQSVSSVGHLPQLVNAKLLGIQSMSAVTRIKPNSTGIRMMNTSNLNIANIAGKPVIISNKSNGPTANHQQSQPSSQQPQQIPRQNVIWQNAPSNSTSQAMSGNTATTTTTNFMIGGQTVKVHGNLLQSNSDSTVTGRPATSSQSLMFGNQLIKLHSSTNQATVSQSATTQQQSVVQTQPSQTQSVNVNTLGNATLVSQPGGTTRTVVLGPTGQTIRVHSPAQQPSTNSMQTATVVGQSVKNTIRGTGQLTSVAGQQRVVLAVQGGGQILLPPGFQGGSINLKSLQGLKVIPMVQQNQSKDNSSSDRPMFTQIISAPKGPRPPNPSTSDS